MLYDSHAHLNNESFSPEERERFVAATRDAVTSGLLSYVNDIGFDLESSLLAVRHAEQYDWCYAAVGCHPHDTKAFDEAQLEMIRALAQKEKVKAIGEIGLDFYYDHSDRDTQRYWFRRQIQLANELGMPIVIHDRDANAECMQILKEEGAFSDTRRDKFPRRPAPADIPNAAKDARVLLHCYSGSRELAEQYIRLGATISIAGPITYKNSRKTIEVAEAIPLEFLLVETDSPYLTPVPHRGERNLPPYVEFTARKLAEVKDLSFEGVAAATKKNAMRFFAIE